MSRAASVAQEMDWRFALDEIRWSAGNLGERFANPADLAVFDPAGRVDPQRALEILRTAPSGERIGGARERRIRQAPSHSLRRRVAETLDVLRQRPPDRLGELEQLEALRRATEVLYKEELTHTPSHSDPEIPESGQARRPDQLTQRLDELD